MADSVVILDTEKPVEFIDIDPDDRTPLTEGLQKVADLINAFGDAPGWLPAQREAFNLMKKIVFFRGTIVVDGYDLSRPGSSQATAVFYWEVGEFLKVADAGVRANTLFHDCWHVAQYEAAGNRGAVEMDERVEREVDALNKQIEVATALKCYQADIDYLVAFRDDPAAIRARLEQGCVHHTSA